MRPFAAAVLCSLFLMLPACGDRQPGEVESPAAADAVEADAKTGAGDASIVAPQEEPQPPALKFRDHNVVFVSFDALQARHVGALGYKRDVTPTIDRFAKTGFNFRNNTSVASWTVPSSMTWFTGAYPSEHRMVNKYARYQPPVRNIANLQELSPQLETLASVLQKNGYATGGFTGNAGVSGGFGYEDGFDKYYYEKGKFGRMEDSIVQATHWLRANKDKKFFLFLHGYDVHGQCTPAGGYDYRFVAEDYDNTYTGAELEQELLREAGLDKGQLTLRPEDVAFWRAVYDEKIQRVDEKFKYFLEDFNKLGVADKTIFILTSDHGTEICEHRRFDHGFTLYQELIHTPLIIKTPGAAAPRQITQRVSSIDIMPTILDLLEIQPSQNLKKQLRGRSLLPAMQHAGTPAAPPTRDVFSETDYREYTFKRSIISPDGWKLIYTLENDRRELYYLPDDPAESVNQINKQPQKAAALQDRLFKHFKAIGHDLKGRNWKTGLNPVYPSQGK